MTAMRVGRPKAFSNAAANAGASLVSMKVLVNSLGTANRMVPSMSPNGFAIRRKAAWAGPSSSRSNCSRARSQAEASVEPGMWPTFRNPPETPKRGRALHATLLGSCPDSTWGTACG